MTAYAYTTLTSAVADKRSPLRRYLEDRFPNTRPLQADYKQGAGAILVDGGDAHPGTIGAAFDYLIRFGIDSEYRPEPALLAFPGGGPEHNAVQGLVRAAAAASIGADLEQLARACWGLALCTEVYRVGLRPGSPLVAVTSRHDFSATALLGLASEDAVRELSDLHQVASERLLPHVVPATCVLGPSFEGSALCSADADVIAGGTLLELKSHLGPKNQRTGARSDSLSLTALYQLVAYVLFDRSDTYAIHAIGAYSARYGNLARWPLAESLATMAEAPVDLKVERERVWRLLGGQTIPLGGVD